MHTFTAVLGFTLLLSLASTFVADAAEAAEASEVDHDHHRLTTDPDLTLSELVTRTLARTPAIQELNSQNGFAAAWDTRGSNWFSAAPALSLRYQIDRFNQDYGFREYEAWLQLPLWRWGEKSATAAFANSLDRETKTARARLRWEISGAVRLGLWRVAEAEIDHDMAKRSGDFAASVLASVERAHELGDRALGEVLIARSNQLQAVNVLIEKEAALLDAERTFSILIQDSVRPEFQTEELSHLRDLPPEHVLILWLNSRIDRASASRDRIEKSSRGGPSVLLGPKREQAPNDSVHYDSFGLTLSFPFATGSHSAPEIAAADRAHASSLAERDRQLRRLQLMFHEASHELTVIAEQLAAAVENAAMAKQQIEMGNRAYEAGELNLLNLLQIQNTALAAERHAALLTVARKRTIALYNQAVGDTP